MKAYKEFKKLDLPQLDKDILDYWAEHKVFEKSIENRKDAPAYVFYEGPPSANGKPGIHHVMARAIKDIFCRYHTMKGERVERKGGWDTHGLPVELAVEKELGITKEDIGTQITVEEYNQKCRETVMRFKDMWDDLTIKMGYWVDLDDPYITYENDYIESVWWLLKHLYDKDLMYKGYTIQPYSPAAGTGLSSHELNMPGAYKDVTDTTVVAMFKVEKGESSAFLFDNEDEDVRILAWTTTPWTLPSNTALTVGPKVNYVKVKTVNTYTDQPVSVVLAEDLVSKWMGGKKQPEVLEQSSPFKGKELDGIRYEQLLAFGNEIEELQGKTDAFRVILGDFVTTEDGTGVVHTAPSFGADDRLVAVKNGIGALTLVDKSGKFKSNVGEFSNRYVKNYKDDPDFVQVDIDIAVHLKLNNKALNVQKYSHNYPHCWRTDKPVLYYPLDSWFIRSTAAKERMIELNKTIKWKPAHTGEKRFGNWLENLQDWNLSRSRFWGVPLPIWRTEDGEEELCVGSMGELRKEVEKAIAKGYMDAQLPEDFDMHRPYIDNVVLVSPSGKPMKREKDLIDVWFDSGSMPYAQWHYPFENEEKFKDNYPADFIAEGVDQTRGWFFTLHAIAVMVFDSVSFKNVVSNGLVLDKNGQKMSKRLGNAVDPFETLSTYGADATRWYMISNAQPWDNLRFDLEGLDEVRRKFFGTLYNTYSFFALYANVDSFYYEEEEVQVADRPEIDRWILSLLNSLVKEVDADYAEYEPTRATRKIASFVTDNLSNWYVRLCRRRFWKGEKNADKLAAYQTLSTCLMTVAKLMAPVAPFFSDFLYRNLNNVSGQEAFESVHLAFFPEANENLIDKDLEERMDYAQRISSLVLSLRKKDKLRVRQPLSKILLPVLNNHFQEQVEAVKNLILSEVNVKDIEYVKDTSGMVKKSVKPNFKTLGRRLGKHMKAASVVINGFNQDDIAAVEQSGSYKLDLDGESFDLTLEDFIITAEEIPGWSVANDGPLTVALDINMTDELLAEGTARELVNRIQNIRKDKDFNVTDRISLTLEKNDALASALNQFSDYIKNEVLATNLEIVDSLEDGQEVQLVDDVVVKLEVTRT
ncbi:MAG: isoleucine--tRNA ligase [Bacteroidota bacterium]